MQYNLSMVTQGRSVIFHQDSATQGQKTVFPSVSLFLNGGKQNKTNFPRISPADLTSWLIGEVYVTCPDYDINHWTEGIEFL